MPRLFKINAVISCLLTVLFLVFFMYLKHDPVLSQISPFVEDPYDAVGSFAYETVIFLSLLALYRAFRPLGKEGATLRQQSILAHTEVAVPLSVLLTVGSNAVAMARHLALWVGASDSSLLLGLQAGMAIAALLTGALIWLPVRRKMANAHLHDWIQALIVLFAAMLLLTFYPEILRASVPGALLTVEVGALVLFASLWALGTALMPDDSAEPLRSSTPLPWWGRRSIQWGAVIVLAVIVGLILVAVELTDGAGAPMRLPRLALIASVYVGLEVVGVLIGFAFLRRWLALFR